MDRIDELAIFVRIVEEGSLAGAAKRLRRSPPAITRALAALEQRIGLRLIDRTTRRLAPTEAGRAMLERARTLLGDYDAAIQGGEDAPVRGLLRIAAPVQFGRRHVAPVVQAFLDAFEAVEVELLLGDRNIDLIDEAVDVAVRIGPLADSTLTARGLGEVRRLWVASPAYLRKRGTPRHLHDLARHEVILGTPALASTGASAGGRRPRLNGRLRTDDIETRLQAAIAGRGLTQLLSYQAADDLAAGRLVRVLAEDESPSIPVHLLTKGTTHRAPKIAAFVDFAAPRLSALPVLQTEDRLRPAAGRKN
ncbi:MAG: LysR family transcriptional regulator [Alphaproteobacteria bacterium]|nr:LysR family transcriptional regulator [Alphaproteobacteria bacterium]